MTRAMSMLARHPRTMFLGQAVEYPGTTMSGTLEGVPEDRLLELPVVEEMQMGMSIGLALAGYIPVTLYPRWNFLLLAANQMVNHLDKIVPRVIVRVGVGSEEPMYPGPQHLGNFTEVFRSICRNIHFEHVIQAGHIVPAYRAALERPGPSVIVEFAKYYQDRR